MVKLPTAVDLGPAPRANSQIPIARIDATPIARGYASIAQATTELGQAQMKAALMHGQALGNLGQGIERFGAGLDQVRRDMDGYEYAKAKAQFLADKVDLDARTARDRNYGPDGSGSGTVP
jgi:hypothetical protein